ncbi:B-box zinc finger protein 32 [Nymphaea thermarum]|nr:B-box zinc finger protein 32 [Nymphaea thermarum]
MKECELCKKPARIHCESDQASLCLACDAKVHSANFLVARHSRTLLCQSCQAPTPWRAAGARLVPVISVCLKCVGRCRGEPASDLEVDSRERMIAGEGDEEETDDGDEDDVEAEEVEEQEEDEREDGENQVVPWTSSLSGPAASPSSGDESFRRGGHDGCAGFGAETAAAVSMKRKLDDGDFIHQEWNGCSSSQANCGVADDEATSSSPTRSPKELKKVPVDSEGAGSSRRLQTNMFNGPLTTAVELSKRPSPSSI